jgi:acyl carrier protein
MSDDDDLLQRIFREVFDDDDLTLRDDMTAADIEAWNSLHHINLMYVIEEEFGVQFAGNQLAELANIGELRAFLDQHGTR